MVIDYKGVSFSFKAQKRRKQFKRFRLIVLAAAAVFLFFFIKNLMDAGRLGDVRELLLANKITEAARRLENIERDMFHASSKKELKALIRLCDGDRAGAGEILTTLTSENTAVHPREFLEHFSNHGKYRELKLYTDSLVGRGMDLPFYRALYHSALFDAAASKAIIETMPEALKEERKEKLALIRRVNQQLEAGKVDYIFDVNGSPMAFYDPARKQTVSLVPGLSYRPFNDVVTDGVNFFSLTIDAEAQNKVHRLFEQRGYRGTFLLLDLADTGIAAAYSRSYEGGPENAVFSEAYEPGSIIKVLTLFAYLQTGGDDLFPYDCKGTTPINGKVFYDWFRHGAIETYDEALAVSCNISFARMGISLGIAKLGALFDKFYFNQPGFTDLFMEFKTGTYDKSVADDYRMANLSEGLNEISMTTFHAALTAALITRDGSVYAPYLIKNKKNLFNLGYYQHPEKLLTVIDDSVSFLKVKNAMIRVVDDPRGTGRRSKVDFARVGVKTGTSGSKKLGLDAVLIGFFPAEKPRYAFAFRLERVGKAELNGAYFLRDFLNSFYNQ